MRLRSILLVGVAMMCVCTVVANPAIIPTPKSYIACEGEFRLLPSHSVTTSSATLMPLASYLAEHLNVEVETKGAIMVACLMAWLPFCSCCQPMFIRI